jgi:acyl-CoA-binding protein
MWKMSDEAELHPAQKFKVKRLHRHKIKNAKYNPRKIDDHARKKLKENIKKRGLLEPPVWNEVTGNLVGGHQRLKILDMIAGNDIYLLDVSVVHLSPKEEKEQNVFFNNPDTQGTYDDDVLFKMVTDGDIDYRKAGFDDMTLQIKFEGMEGADTIFDTDDAPKAVRDDMAQLEEIQRIKRERKEHRERDQKANDPEFMSIVVFPDRDSQSEFMDRVTGDRNGRYVDGVRLRSALDATKPQTKTKDGGEFQAMTFWVHQEQRKVIEDELVRIGALLKGKNIRGRALEGIAVISSQTPIENITGEEPEVEVEPKPKRRRA